MKLKLDENLAGRGWDVLSAAGHDVVTVTAEGLDSAEDRTVYTVCCAEQRGLVTLDLDFANPFVHPPEPTAGLMVLRLPAKPSRADVLAAMRVLAAALADADPRGQLWVVDHRQVRIYRPDDDD